MSMQQSNADLKRPMLRMGSVAFLAGIVIIIVSTLFHASSEDLMDNPVVFAVYAESDAWIAAHIGQFDGVMLVFAGGFVALFRLLVKSESGTIGVAIAKSALLSRWIGVVGIFAGAATILAGVIVAYVGFSSVRAPIVDASTVISFAWLVILGIFMWRKTRLKVIT